MYQDNELTDLKEEIKKLCLEFDAVRKKHPELKWEGKSFFEFYLLGLEISRNDIDKELEKYSKEPLVA
ncbi:MAG: hypothetical protein Q7S42_01310 [Candidatus Omnitrophota bacterium]|nr:hypothetical protein [Candidatus Omnitrophota bacterium]